MLSLLGFDKALSRSLSVAEPGHLFRMAVIKCSTVTCSKTYKNLVPALLSPQITVQEASPWLSNQLRDLDRKRTYTYTSTIGSVTLPPSTPE